MPSRCLLPLAGLVLLSASEALAGSALDSLKLTAPVAADAASIHPGPFQPTWTSLARYQVPDWYKNAKFGIWAHWGPQCEAEDGDWYGRNLYDQGSPQNRWHVAHWGPPSKVGFKDVIHAWKAEHWDPDALLALYKRAGAQYFMALANHHDNFDLWDSKYQEWNSVAIGPKKDLIAGWAAAARRQGLKFGVSVHAAHAWTWYETAQGADKTGPYAGVPYDGNLVRGDGKGTWWDGLDPQDLYAQRHPLNAPARNWDEVNAEWNWGAGASLPDGAYCTRFYNRIWDLINQARPDLVYFDDTALPLWPVSDAGLRLAAHFYNSSIAWNGGKNEAVLFGKMLTAEQRQCVVWDVERGQSPRIEPLPWQSDTCIGNWHYDRQIFLDHRYKTTTTVLQTLADVVSKNGNLLLSVPVRADGTIDSDEVGIVEGIADWMAINRECIFGTTPWKVCGEGPALAAAAEIEGAGFNEGKGKPFTGADLRFTQMRDALYVIVLGPLKNSVRIASLGGRSCLLGRTVTGVTLLGVDEPVMWKRTPEAMTLEAPLDAIGSSVRVFRLSLSGRS